MKKIFGLILSAAVLGTVLTACGGSGASEPASASGSAVNSSVYGTTLADIQAKGELVIGLDDTFAPMGFRDESGNLVGFDIDLATAVCEELGVKATFQPIDWDAKEMELSSGNIDCIWNGMSITPEREEAMSLSQAYLNNKIVIMTKEGVTVSAKEDLANYNIGIQAGSAALEAVTNDAVYASIQDKITEYPTYDEVILDVQAGRLDCMIIDEVYGGYKNAKREVLIHGVFSMWVIGAFIPIVVTRDAYYQNLLPGYGQEYADTLMAYMPDWILPVLLAAAFVSGLVGGLIGRKLFKKHFERAGIVS